MNAAAIKGRDVTFEGAFCVCGEKGMWVTWLTQQVISGEYLSYIRMLHSYWSEPIFLVES